MNRRDFGLGLVACGAFWVECTGFNTSHHDMKESRVNN